MRAWAWSIAVSFLLAAWRLTWNPSASPNQPLSLASLMRSAPQLLPVVFGEFQRTLAPGGCLMLAGHVGADGRPAPTSHTGIRRSSGVLRVLLAAA